LVPLLPENQILVEMFFMLRNDFISESNLGEVVLALHEKDIEVLGGMRTVMKRFIFLSSEITKNYTPPTVTVSKKAK